MGLKDILQPTDLYNIIELSHFPGYFLPIFCCFTITLFLYLPVR